MAFWEAFVLALALGLDTLGIGLSLGAAQRERNAWLFLRFALVVAAFQTLTPVLGWLVGTPLGSLVEGWSHWAAFALLAYAGGRMIWEGIEGDEEEPLLDLRRWRTLLLLGVATSLDELAVGVGVGVAGRPIALLAILDFAWTFCFALGGVYLGHKVGEWLGRRAPILGGAVLLFIGVRMLLEGLGH